MSDVLMPVAPSLCDRWRFGRAVRGEGHSSTAYRIECLRSLLSDHGASRLRYWWPIRAVLQRQQRRARAEKPSCKFSARARRKNDGDLCALAPSAEIGGIGGVLSVLNAKASSKEFLLFRLFWQRPLRVLFEQ